MKKLLCMVVLSLGFFAVAVEAVKVSGTAQTQIKETSPGVFQVTVQPQQGWPSAMIAVPPSMIWENGSVEFAVKWVSPAGTFPGNLVIGTANPKNVISGAGYVTGKLTVGKNTQFKFPCVGGNIAQYIQLAVKNPSAAVTFEISNIKFNSGTFNITKKRLPEIPPLKFKGKPFFPLGSYDVFRVREGAQLGSIDERFIEAGGNFVDLHGIYLPEDMAETQAYKDTYHRTGQPALYAALDKMKNDPRFANIAIQINIGPNVAYDASQSEWVGMNTILKPLSGEKLERHKKVLSDAVAKLSTYPNIIGYTFDEPENCVWKYYSATRKKEWEKFKDKDLAECMLKWMMWMRPVIKENHPGALIIPVLGWWTTYEQMAPFYDVLIANTYQGAKVGAPEFSADLFVVNYDAACQVAAVRAAGNGKSAIFMPAMYDILPGARGNTIHEQLYVMFAPITRGVMGIHGWRLQRCSDEYRKFIIYPAMKEVDKLKEYFLGEWHDDLISSDRDTASVDYLKKFKTRIRLVEDQEDGVMEKVDNAVPDVSYCLRKHPDGSYLLLAVNNMREPITVNFTINLPGLPNSMYDNINKSCVVGIKGRKAQVKFEPFGVHAFIIKPVK